MQLRTFDTHDEWLNERRAGFGVGASAVGAILGESSYRSPWDVWSTHHAPGAVNPGNVAQLQRGHHLERHILRLYGEAQGIEVKHYDRTICYHPDQPWARFSPDGIRADGGIVEVKTARGGWAWRDVQDPIETAADLHYLPSVAYGLQAYWQMLVSGAEFVDLVVLPLGHELAAVADALAMDHPAALETLAEAIKGSLVVVRVMRDAQFLKRLGDRVAAWRAKHLVDGLEPPAEGPSASAYHGRQVKRGEVDLSVDHPVIELADALFDAKRQKRQLDAKVKAYTGRLKQACQHVQSVTSSRGTIVWRKAGRGKAVDLKGWIYGGTTDCDHQPEPLQPPTEPTGENNG